MVIHHNESVYNLKILFISFINIIIEKKIIIFTFLYNQSLENDNILKGWQNNFILIVDLFILK